MSKRHLFIGVIISLFANLSFAQIEGVVHLPDGWGKKIYLSLIDDYRNMTFMSDGYVLSSMELDSTGYFRFEKDLLSEKNELYRLHVSPDSMSSEVYYADLEEGGLGYNYYIFSANINSHIEFVLGSSVFKNKYRGLWEELDDLQLQNYIDTYQASTTVTEKHTKDFHSNIVERISEATTLEKFIGCYYLMKAEGRLQSYYIESILSHQHFIENLISESADYPGHQKRLTDEFDIVLMQADAQSLSDYKKENRILYYVIFGLVFIKLIFLFFMFKPRLKKPNQEIALSTQEEKVFHLMLEGKSNQDIADALFVSKSTVKSHINSIYKKKGVSSREELKKL
ncbi:MAG: helix-turn-helix transcriptional regulator [Crocinitomicaceae bacterium]|nr:helix-turn-helix transcriptional regulator [Crocinitomicaceae bacterium]